jgi:L-iditol 2-dehydrogenase
MKSVFARRPTQFDVRDIPVPPVGPEDVLVRVNACGLCGTDLRTAATAEEYTPIGHELAGVVEAVGSAVRNVKAGENVCLESGSFDRFSALARNGQVDRDMTGRSMFNPGNGSMGFAEYIVVPCEACVPFSGLSFAEAALMEPLGVAYDLIKVTGIDIGDDVLVYGAGPIGLFALRLARLSGARKVLAVSRSGHGARDRLARAWGADDVIHPDIQDIMAYRSFANKILMTATPDSMPGAMGLMNVGGVMGFIGIGAHETRHATFDMRDFHDRKLQIRASNAVPALYFPACLDLCAAGMVDAGAMISHSLRLEHFAEDVDAYRNDREGALKAVMKRN